MYTYRYQSFTRHVLPDDRLVRARVAESGLIILEYRAWHIHPALSGAIDALCSGISACGLMRVDPDREEEPLVSAWFYPTDPELIPEEAPMAHTAWETGGRTLFEFWVRNDMVDPALIRELNGHEAPAVCRTFVPAGALLPPLAR